MKPPYPSKIPEVPKAESPFRGRRGHTPTLFLLLSLCLFACATTDTATPTLRLTPDPTLAPTHTPTSTPLPSQPNPNAYTWQQIAGSFDRPLHLTYAGDGSGRLFVVEQGGLIETIQNGEVLPRPFLDLTGIANDNAYERGLLGLAFHPNYPENGLFFVNYTDGNGDTVVARYRVSDDPNRADPSSATVILQVDQPFPNHNGGDLEFGPDGYLYIGLGDGGSAGDPFGNGQNLEALLGKMLRIDVNQEPYGIPPDNPFVGRSDARPEIWAYGLRNPWRYSFDRATGDLYIADVGQHAYEEVNFQPADSQGGENYGWNFMEGLHPYEGTAPDGLIPPVTEYTHSEGGCSVTGGYVYRGPSLPELNGVYFFGDYCTGIIWALYPTDSGWQRSVFMNTNFLISAFGEDEGSELYVVDHKGAVYQLAAVP